MKDKVIIIPVHNQYKLLDACLQSIYEMTDDPKVIIVDDGSGQETAEFIDRAKDEYGYDLVRHEKALGFSKACNDGMQFALDKYDFSCLCLLNSDTEIRTKDWFDKVQWYIDNGEKIGVASVMSDCALAQTVKNYDKYMAVIDTKPAVYSCLLHGFCYFINRELIDVVGLLDEVTFPHYGSEDDYSLKSIKAGYKNLLVGKVFVHHANSQSYSEAQRAAIIIKSYPALLKKWGRGIVNRCGKLTVEAGNYINKY